MSRPVEADRARLRLNARAMLARTTPAVETLRAALREKPVNPDGARLLLDQALSQIESAARGMTAMATASEARGGDPVAAAIGVYDDAVKREIAISTLAAGIGRLNDDVRIAQRVALLDMVLAASKDAVRPAYLEKFMDRLQEAGLTKEIAQSLSREQMDGIREILGVPKKERKSVGSRQKTVTRIDIPPPTQSPWQALIDLVPGYRYKLRPADRGDAEDVAILAAALPPMTTIEGFRAGAAVDLVNLQTDSSKARFAWDTMDAWLKVHHPSTEEVLAARRRAWTFLLGHVHGFIGGVKGLEKVRFASPWQVNQIVTADREVNP